MRKLPVNFPAAKEEKALAIGVAGDRKHLSCSHDIRLERADGIGPEKLGARLACSVNHKLWVCRSLVRITNILHD